MSAVMLKPGKFWNTEQLAEYLNLSVPAIYNRRYRGTGPLGIRIGRELYFSQEDVRAWLEARRALSERAHEEFRQLGGGPRDR